METNMIVFNNGYALTNYNVHANKNGLINKVTTLATTLFAAFLGFKFLSGMSDEDHLEVVLSVGFVTILFGVSSAINKIAKRQFFSSDSPAHGVIPGFAFGILFTHLLLSDRGEEFYREKRLVTQVQECTKTVSLNWEIFFEHYKKCRHGFDTIESQSPMLCSIRLYEETVCPPYDPDFVEFSKQPFNFTKLPKKNSCAFNTAGTNPYTKNLIGPTHFDFREITFNSTKCTAIYGTQPIFVSAATMCKGMNFLMSHIDEQFYADCVQDEGHQFLMENDELLSKIKKTSFKNKGSVYYSFCAGASLIVWAGLVSPSVIKRPLQVFHFH